MLDLLKSLWYRAVSEGGVVSGAPMLFGGAVLFLAALAALGVWQLMDWRYSGVIANRDATIGARDSQIGLLNAQVKDLETRVGQLNAAVPEAPINPDAIFQLGTEIARGVGAQADLGNGRYYFRTIIGSGDFNKNAKFKYRNYTLKIVSTASEMFAGMAGETKRQFIDVVCDVLQD